MFALRSTARATARANIARGMATSVEVTTLPNGVKVVSTGSNSGIATLAVTVSGGSMYETSSNAGVSHYLRDLAFQSTGSRTAVRIAREGENTGTQYSSVSGRDFLQYKAQTLKSNAPYVADVLTEVVGDSLLEDWEASKQNERVSQDLAIIAQNDEANLVDDFHRAAFWGSPLARSPNCLASNVGSVNGAEIRAFRDSQFAASTTVVVGVGMTHADLVEAASKHLSSLSSSSPSVPATTFCSSESFVPTSSPNADVMLGVATNGMATVNDFACSLVLRQLFGGNGSSVKWASDASASTVGAAVASGTSSPFKVSGFAALYKSNGLVGTHISVDGADASQAITAAGKAVKDIVAGVGISENFEGAKQKALLGLVAESQEDITSCLSSQHFYNTASNDEVMTAVKNLTVEGFTSTVKASNFVLAARGNIDNVPRLSQL
eukprot:m.23100 g.23100  ORF g.23100 m.23100 type:complete len:437 (+) comp8936_c0_seq1:214-1524(+)